MNTTTSGKPAFICGDFNIDLLNPNKHRVTDDFINTIYSMSLFPKISRPTRITSHCATLIDNIFTNDILNSTISGLLITDISDHLPIYRLYNYNHKHAKREHKIYRRIRTEDSLTAFQNDLMTQNWDTIYRNNSINEAYEEFQEKCNKLYDTEIKHKQKYGEHSWITKGLQNACKKKNTLYREFIRLRTTDVENKYKKYRNKLINIIRKF